MDSGTKFRIALYLLCFVLLSYFAYLTYGLVKSLEITPVYVVLSIFVLALFLYAYTKLYLIVANGIDNIRIRNERFKGESRRVEEFLQKNVDVMNLEELRETLVPFERTLLLERTQRKYGTQLNERLAHAKQVFNLKLHRNELDQLNRKKDLLEYEILEAEKKRNRVEQSEERRLEAIKANLHIPEHDVYLLDDLNPDAIKILKAERYRQSNEYDILREEIVTALIRPINQHSNTHTFLVWSTIRYLENTGEYETIREHRTVDADITFKYLGKTYALEIETGNLLSKQKQLKEKINYLHKRYRNRWMFIVSNKDLVSKYRAYGLSTHRKGMEENLQKLLSAIHPQKSGGKHPNTTRNNKKKSRE